MGLADLGRHATLEPAGAHRKGGARDSTAMESRQAVGAPGFKLRWTEPRGPFGDSAGVASGQTPKKPEERTASRRESDQESKGAGEDPVSG